MKIKSFAILLCGMALVAGAAASGGLIYSSYISKEANAASSYTWTAANKDHEKFNSKSGTADLGGITWDYTQGDTKYAGWQTNCMQLGSSKGSNGIITLSASLPASYGSAISSVSVVSGSTNASKALSIKIGGETIVNDTPTAKWSSTSAISTGTMDPVKTGVIQLSWTAGSQALYLKSITIVGADVATDFVTDLDVDPTSKSYHTSSVLQVADFDVSVTKNGAPGNSSDYTAKIGTGVGAGFTGRDIVWGTTQPILADETIQFKAKYPQSALDLTYLTVDVAINVSAVTLSSLAISGTLAKSAYYEDEQFEPAGITVTAAYSDGSYEDVTSKCSYAPSVLSAETTSVTASYTIGGVTKTAPIGGISVTARSVAAISVLTNPTKMSYSIGQIFNPAGMKIRATYNVGPTNDDYLAYIFAPTSAFLTAGNKTITITSSDDSSITTTLDVEVTDVVEGTYTIKAQATTYRDPLIVEELDITKTEVLLGDLTISDISNTRLNSSPNANKTITIGGNATTGGKFTITLPDGLYASSVTFNDLIVDSGKTPTLKINDGVRFVYAAGMSSATLHPYAHSLEISTLSTSRIWTTSIEIVAKSDANAALDFGTHLLDKTSAECANLAVKSSTWDQIAASYNGADSSIKAIIDASNVDQSGNDLEKAMARYDYIVEKYHYVDFLAHGISSISRNVFVNTSSNTTLLFLSFATIIVSGTCLYFLLKKKKAK